jgi:hypothetical protein
MKNFKIVWKVKTANREIVNVEDVKAENSIEAIDKMFSGCPVYTRKKISDISIMEC